ncbi:MAG: diacylglycerol/polyprenol kinase family protein, partial [Gammaproteobacteria bacterium]
MTAGSWQIVFLFSFLLLAMLGVVRFLQQEFGLSSEVTRKVLHICAGLTACTFPWIFTDTRHGIAVSAIAMAVLLLIRNLKCLRDGLGTVIHGVRRQSFGEIFIFLSVGLLFYLSDGDPILFCIPVLILTFADSAAAFIGLRYGRNRFYQSGGMKSLEGCCAFCLVSFFSTFAFLAIYADFPMMRILVFSTVVSASAAGVEAVSGYGS